MILRWTRRSREAVSWSKTWNAPLLDPSPGLVELRVCEFHDVKRIRDERGGGQHRFEHRPIWTGEVDRRVRDLVPPGPALSVQPRLRFFARATRDDIEELASADVDELRGELGSAEPARPDKEHLVEAERRAGVLAVEVAVDERLAIGDNGIVHGVPVTAEVACDLGLRPCEPANLDGRPSPRPRGHRHPRRRDPRVLLASARPRAIGLGAAKAPLVPAEPRRPAEAWKVDEGDDALILQLGDRPTVRATDRRPPTLDVDLRDRSVEDAEHHDVGKPDEDLAHPLGIPLKAEKHLSSRRHPVSLSARHCRFADA